MKALAIAERIPSGAVHINDQTVDDEPVIPFGGVGRLRQRLPPGGAAANLEPSPNQWVTARARSPQYPSEWRRADLRAVRSCT